MQILTIGRDANNNIVLSDNFASRQHAQLILMDNGQVLLKDLGSANGTFVNGNRISECYLTPGDVVKCASAFLNWQQYVTPNTTDQKQSQAFSNPNSSGPIPKFRKRPVLMSTYIAIGVLFLLPFCDLKCGGETIKTFSGVDLMIGGEMKESGKDVFSFQEKAKNNQEEKVDPNPFIITVFLSTLLGLVILIIKDKNQYKISFYASLVGLASLITFIINIKNKINDPITIEFDFAFWLTMICLLIAIILSYLEGFKPINRSGKNFFL